MSAEIRISIQEISDYIHLHQAMVNELMRLHCCEDPLLDGGWCGHCRDPWPCTTAMIVKKYQEMESLDD